MRRNNSPLPLTSHLCKPTESSHLVFSLSPRETALKLNTSCHCQRDKINVNERAKRATKPESESEEEKEWRGYEAKPVLGYGRPLQRGSGDRPPDLRTHACIRRARAWVCECVLA